MSTSKSLCCAGIALAVAAVVVAAGGQGPGRGFGHGKRFDGFNTAVRITGAPYSATRTITHVQKLSDGATITHTTIIQEARDSNGRTYSETLPETGSGQTRSFFHVFDPVDRVNISWSSGSKRATVMHLPDPAAHPGPRTDAPITGRSLNYLIPLITPENLGSKTIGGVVADGTRISQTIPTGKMGNDQPLTSTHDSWFCTDLTLEVMHVDTDPRSGTTTTELSNISRDEPAASLFQVPAGYTVQNHNAGERPGRP